VAAWGQFRDLATTSDGSQLFFITALRQHGTTRPLFAKIVALQGTAVALVYQPPVPPPSPYSQYSVGPLQAAGDGSWIVCGTERVCIGGSSCFLNEQRGAILVRRGGEPEAVGANARLSRDGRWLVSHSSPNAMAWYFWRTDLRTGVRTDLKAVAHPHAVPSVALNGTVLIRASDGLLVWDGAQRRTVAGSVTAAAMNDAATTVVYQENVGASDARRVRLRVVDLASGAVWPLGPDDRDNFSPVLSADGAWVLYLSRIAGRPQVFFSRRDGSEWRQLTDLAAGVREATLSGDGRVAWVAAGDGAVFRVDTRSGAIEQRIAATPMISGPLYGAVGSAAIVSGSGLAKVTAVCLGARAVEWRLLDAERLLFQVPWGFPKGETELETAGGDERFDYAIPFSVYEYSPTVLAVIHEDFSALVTEDRPAHPGEILHLYATGLGPVDAGGRTTSAWKWTWSSPPDQPVELFYVGLAPALPGFYQVDLRLPAALPPGTTRLGIDLALPDGHSWRPVAEWPVAQRGMAATKPVGRALARISIFEHLVVTS
jgi:uncharacterized protein (TIGR03437 family)